MLVDILVSCLSFPSCVFHFLLEQFGSPAPSTIAGASQTATLTENPFLPEGAEGSKPNPALLGELAVAHKCSEEASED